MKTRSLITRLFSFVIAVIAVAALPTGCAPATMPSPSPSPSVSAPPNPSPSPSPSAAASASASASASPKASASVGPSQASADTTTSASIVNNAAAFQNAISKNGTWIIAILNDLKFDTPLTVDGSFMNTKTPPASQRKLALYAQDANRNVTARYTLTAPKMTINSPDCNISYGTFVGDLYVAANNFQLIGATVTGNIYFTNAAAQSSFKADANSKVSGVQQLKTS